MQSKAPTVAKKKKKLKKISASYPYWQLCVSCADPGAECRRDIFK